MKTAKKEIVIVGSGMVGMSVAYQLLERDISKNIIIIEKEKDAGFHSSGRNSGVLHAGLYYKPDSLKAKVSVRGSKRLKAWVEERKLSINKCGKIVVPTDEKLDIQLEKLFERGKKNGAKVEFLDEKQLFEMIPDAYSPTGRALWSPNTCVVNPKEVVNCIKNDLKAKGVRFFNNANIISIKPDEKKIIFSNLENLSFGYLFNCAGLQADRIANYFNIGKDYLLLPFKGLYWKLKKDCPIRIERNLYPVPDLSVPFLGVHFTPNTMPIPEITIGPTATPAWGRENYRLIEGLEPLMSLQNSSILLKQYFLNKGGFRKYVHEQSLQSFQPFFFNAAKKLVPSLKSEYIEISDKVGIRAQLFNKIEEKLVDDFICLNTESSSHVLNAISPAFTASFELADLILNQSSLLN